MIKNIQGTIRPQQPNCESNFDLMFTDRFHQPPKRNNSVKAYRKPWV